MRDLISYTKIRERLFKVTMPETTGRERYFNAGIARAMKEIEIMLNDEDNPEDPLEYCENCIHCIGDEPTHSWDCRRHYAPLWDVIDECWVCEKFREIKDD